MLKLPIFQNSQFEKENKEKIIKHGPSHNKSTQKDKPYNQNRKKAEFQKKIKRFIQADSPTESHPKFNIPKASHNYSFHPHESKMGDQALTEQEDDETF